MQFRYPTELSAEDYVRTEAWEFIVVVRCPIHPDSDCRITRHGTYPRKIPGSGGGTLKTHAKIGCSGKSADGHAPNSVREKSGNGRLSKALLHDLRNKIPIRCLIENELGVRSHTESGVFRFECPMCGSFHTSVMKTENLAQCFGCETNFNPIDLVMAVGNTGFRKSADFLTGLLESGTAAKPTAPDESFLNWFRKRIVITSSVVSRWFSALAVWFNAKNHGPGGASRKRPVNEND